MGQQSSLHMSTRLTSKKKPSVATTDRLHQSGKSDGSSSTGTSARIEASERLAAREIAKMATQKQAKQRETHLYSPVVEKKEVYTWAEEMMLQNTEANRRETLYMEKALQCMDIVKYPWQAAHFHKWFTEFYQPMLRDLTLVVPLKYCLPAYTALGLEETYTFNEEFDILFGLQTSVIEKMYEVSRDGAPEEEVKQAFEDVRAVFAEFKPAFFDYLAADERFWIPVIDRFGMASYMEIQQQFVADERVQTGTGLKTWLLSVGSMLDHAIWADPGKEEPDSLPTAVKLLPYMSELGLEAWLSRVYSVPSRKQIMPMCRTEYLTNYKILIEACTGTENVVPSPQVPTAIFKARNLS